MDELETVLRNLAATPAFWDKGHEDAGSLTFPYSPAEGDRKWPLVIVYCPGGHVINTINLSCDPGRTSWTIHSDGPGGPGPQEAVNLHRTIFECKECSVNERSQTRRVLTGKTLFRQYVETVMARKDWFRLK